MRLICSERDRLWAEYDAAINSYLAAVKRYAALGSITQVRKPARRWTTPVLRSGGTAASMAAIPRF
jgi:hypothetical protein